MGLSLRNLGRKLWDQVNIADGGKTFNSNRAPIITRSAPVARPQPRPQPVRRPQQSRGFFSAVGNAASSNRYTRPIANYGATLAKNTFTPEQIKTYDENAFEGLKAITAEVASPTNIARANPMLLPSQLRQAATNKLGIKTPTSQSVVDAGIKKFNESRVGKNKVSGFVGNNFVAPIAKSFARASDVGSGASRYDKGLKGFGQYGTDTFNVASMAYTPIKAGVLAKGGVPALKAVPGSIARGAGAGVGINVVDQMGRGVKPGDINWKEAAMVGGIGGAANLLPGAMGLAGRGVKSVAPKIGNTVAKKAGGLMDNPQVSQLRSTYKIMQQQYDNTPNLQSKKTLSKQMADINRQIRAVDQGGYISPGGKPKVTSFDKEYRAKLNQRPDNLKQIEQSKVDMPDAQRLQLAKGDKGQAGIMTAQPGTRRFNPATGKVEIVSDKLPTVGLKRLDESGGGRLPIADKLDDAINGKPKVAAKTNEIRTKASDGVDIDNEIQKAILGDTSAPTYKVGAGGKLAEKLSVNKQLRRATQPVEGVVNKGIRASLESGSRVGRTPGSIVEGLSRQAGRTPQELERLAKFGGQKQYGDVLAKKLATEGEDAVKTGVRKDVIASALDPELAKARGVKPTKLSAIEQAEVDKLRKIIDLTHEGEYKIGLLDEKRYIANKGKYFPRDFTKFFESDAGRQIAKKNKLDLNIFKGRKELGDIPKEVLDAAETDPYFMTALRVQQYTKNKAIMDYTDFISKGKSISDTPRKGYVAVPDSPAYGAIKGKYVLKEQLEDLEGFIYETDVAKNVVALLNAYDRNPIRQGLKATKTVYNPGVRLGNRTFNYLTSSLNGVNPITFTKNYARGRKMIKAGSPEYLEATKAGIFGSSIVDKELYRTKDLLEPKSKNVLKRGHEAASSSYGKVDDEGKMAMYLSFRDRGVSVEEAAKRTRRAMQNYDMVGKYFDLGAKTPVGGSAFVRFSSELMRIAQNSAIDNPLRMAGAMAAVVGITTLASQLSGETPEDRKTREERVGAPRVPFTNQSLEIQTPWGAVNIGRLLGVTTYNDLVGGMQEDAKRLLPFQSPVTNSPDGLKFNPNFVTSDPMIGPLVGQLIDKDFRGKSISDPDKEKYPNQPLSTGEQLKNRLKTAAMAYIPLSNEFDSLNSARKGEENFYGKKRSLTQAALRTAGIKVEKYGPEEAKAQRGKNEYFEGEYARAKDFLKQNPDLKEAYNKFKGREKDRTTGKNYYDIVTPEKWSIIKSDNSGRLYDFLRGEAEKSNKKDGKPVDPVFKLPTKEQQSIVTELRSRPTGEDIETEEILRATQSWYNSFEKAERDYYEANTAYYKDKKIPDTAGERSKAYINVKYPEQPAGVKEYYKLKTDNPDAAKELFKTTNLSDQFDAYAKERLKYINAKRKIEGFPPISETTFDNVTFGFEEDERKVYNELKYGKGYGGYGSRGSRRGGGYGSRGGRRGSNPNDNPDKYRISLSAGGSASVANTIKKPKVVAKAPTSPLLNYGKGKASLKKSKV